MRVYKLRFLKHNTLLEEARERHGCIPVARSSPESMAQKFSEAREHFVEGTTSKAQDKKPMRETTQLFEEDSDYEMEERPVQASKKSVKKKKDPELTPEQYYELFQKHRFEGTRYPDLLTMQELGIDKDVQYLFNQCHLSKMMHTPREAHREETIQFLSSLNLHVAGSLGFITFRVSGRNYSTTTQILDTLFGFPNGTGTKQQYNRAELHSLWATIGHGTTFNSSRTKSTHIRSPVLRYFHKALANVFFARENTGIMVNGEMEFMVLALKELLYNTADGTILQGDTTNTSLSFVLVRQLLNYKKWVEKLQGSGTIGTLCVGGLVTMILDECRVPLETEAVAPRWIDAPYLRLAHALDWDRVSQKMVYNFSRSSPEDPQTLLPSQILLPCVHLTSFFAPGDEANVEFTPPIESLHMTTGNADDGQDTGIIEEPMEIEEDQFEHGDGGYAPERYYFEEYSAPRQGAGVKAAHVRANSLQQWNKAQDELLRAQDRELRAQRKEIKSLKSRFKNFIKKFSCSSATTVLHTTSTSPVRQSVNEPAEQAAYVEEERADYMQEDQPVYAPKDQSLYEQPVYAPEEHAEYATEMQVPFAAPARHSSYHHGEQEYVPIPARSSAHEPRERKRRSVKRKIKRQGSSRRQEGEPSSEHPSTQDQ